MDQAELPDRKSVIVDLRPNASSYDRELKTEFVELFKGYRTVCMNNPLQRAEVRKLKKK
jgi:hypothetical protein